MEPVNPDGPITSATIGAASPMPYIVTGIAAILIVGGLGYATVQIVHTLRRRRLLKQAQQSQIRVLWVRQ